MVGSFPVATSLSFAGVPTKNLDVVFSGVILGRLGSIPNVSAVLWNADVRQFQTLRPQMEALLTQGGSGIDKKSARTVEDLADYLSAQNCDYLFGGQISRDAKILIATPFIFNVAERTFASNLSPVVQEGALPPNRAAELFAVQFAQYIGNKKPGPPENGQQIAVGCIVPSAIDKTRRAQNTAPRLPATDTIDAVQRAFVTELQADTRLAGKVSKPSSLFCASPETGDYGHGIVAAVGAVLDSKDGQLALRVTARAIESGSRKGFELYLTPGNDDLIALQVKQGVENAQSPPAIDYGVVRDAVGRLRRIISAGINANGIVFPGRDEELPATADALSELLALRLENGKNEEALTLAFKALSRARDNPVALLAIARAFINKADAAAGSLFLSSAMDGRDKVPEAALGTFWELAGSTYKAIGQNDRAVEMFSAAKDVFRRQNRESDARRVVRSTSLLLLKMGKSEEARRTLLPLTESKDRDAIYAIAQIDFAKGNIESAIGWLASGYELDKTDVRFSGGLLSAYRLLAKNAVAQKKYPEAIAFLQLGQTYGDDTEGLYLSGVAYHSSGDYSKAIDYYERLLARSGEKDLAFSIWAESAWLNVLECYVLTEQWDKIFSRAPIAMQSELADKKESQLVALYLQSVAAGLKAPSLTVSDFLESEQYKKYDELRKFVSAKKLNWNNDVLAAFVDRRAAGNPDTLQAVRAMVRDFGMDPAIPNR